MDVIVGIDEPVAADADTFVEIEVGGGGQAANVAAWVAALSGRARLVYARTDNPSERLLADDP